MAWNLTGNAGTKPATNFLGTTDGKPLIIQPGAGNVGIGTTNPATKLEIVGDWNGEEGTLRLTGDKPTIRFAGGAIAGNESWILHLGGNGPGNLEFYRRTAPGGWTSVMVLSPGGNVGIGTTAPREKL